PIAPTLLSNGQLIARDVKRRALPSIGRLHLDQPIAAVGVEAQDVIAIAIAIDMRHPADALGEIGPAGGEQAGTLMRKDTFLARTTQRAIAGVALRYIVLPGDGDHLLKFARRRRIAVRWWRADP